MEVEMSYITSCYAFGKAKKAEDDETSPARSFQIDRALIAFLCSFSEQPF